MAKRNSATRASRGKARVRAEIVDIARALHTVGAVSDAALRKTTLRMLGRDALPKVESLSPAEIAEVRERAGVSQAGMAGCLNVAVSTVRPSGRGVRRPA